MESDGAGGGAGRGVSADRMQGQIERLTDALVGTDARSARRGALRSPLPLRLLRSPRRPSLCFAVFCSDLRHARCVPHVTGEGRRCGV